MKCPVCKADNDPGPQCRRCRADLSPLVALEEQRGAALAAAQEAASRGDWGQLASAAARADELRRDDESRRLVALGQLLQRDFVGAWECYRAIPSPDGPHSLGGS